MFTWVYIYKVRVWNYAVFKNARAWHYAGPLDPQFHLTNMLSYQYLQTQPPLKKFKLSNINKTHSSQYLYIFIKLDIFIILKTFMNTFNSYQVTWSINIWTSPWRILCLCHEMWTRGNLAHLMSMGLSSPSIFNSIMQRERLNMNMLSISHLCTYNILYLCMVHLFSISYNNVNMSRHSYYNGILCGAEGASQLVWMDLENIFKKI